MPARFQQRQCHLDACIAKVSHEMSQHRLANTQELIALAIFAGSGFKKTSHVLRHRCVTQHQ